MGKYVMKSPVPMKIARTCYCEMVTSSRSLLEIDRKITLSIILTRGISMKIKLILTVLMLTFMSCSGGSHYEYDLFPVLGSDGKWGYIDKAGTVVISFQFSEAGLFREGRALVKTVGDKALYGFIDKDGKFAIAANFVNATNFSEGIAFVTPDGGSPRAIDKNGEMKYEVKDAEQVFMLTEGMSMFVDAKTGKFGYLNKEGQVVINPQFKQGTNFHDGMASVCNEEGKWGFVNKEGTIVINHQFDDTNPFVNNLAAVMTDKKWGVIDKDGKYKINPTYDYCIVDGKNVFIMQDGKYGWCDNEGKILINPQFEDAYPFGSSKVAVVKSGNKYGFIDKDGKIVVNPQYDEASAFLGDLCIVKMGSKMGLADHDGKLVVNPQYSTIYADKAPLLGMEWLAYDHGYAQTDFIDYGGIVNGVKAHLAGGKILGCDLNTSFESLVSTFRKQPNDFTSYSGLVCVKDSSLVKDVTFTVIARSQDYAAGITSVPGIIEYTLNLAGRSARKTSDVFTEVLKVYSGFMKDESQSSSTTSVYRKDELAYKLSSYGSSIVITLTREMPSTSSLSSETAND